MKKSILSPKWFLLPLSIAVLFLLPSFQHNNSQQPEQKIQVYSDSVYRADSMKIMEVYYKCWDHYNNSNYQALMDDARSVEPLFEKHLAYRQDTFLLEYQIQVHDWVIQGKTLMGDYEEGIKEMFETLEKQRRIFGDSYIYLSTGYVGVAEVYELMGDYEMAIKYHQRSIHGVPH